MWKERIEYQCDHCGVKDDILVYVEGSGLDRASYDSAGCGDTNRDRVRQKERSTCAWCGEVGFSRVPR